MNRARELNVSSPNIANKALKAIAKKQNGKCRQCRGFIKVSEGIVSNGGYYYHKECAQKLHIV
jgi:hypothetical protein